MPFALAAALLASLGLHAAALFLPEAEPTPAPLPEPAPLQAEIVLRPRAAPLAAPPEPVAKAAPKPVRRPSQLQPRPESPVAVATLPAVADPLLADDGAATATPVVDAPAPAEARPTVDDAQTEDVVDATSPQLPVAGEIRYVVQRGDPPVLIGSAVHRWRMADGRYRIVSTMETTGVAAWLRAVQLDVESSGRLVADGLAPERYRSRRADRGRERVEQADFDRDAGLVRFGNGTTAPLPAGAQDLLSFNYQLGWLARTGDMAIATGRKLGTWRLELLGREWLETPSRQIWTLHFRASGETTTEVWLAPDEHLLPVKILHIDKKGERFEQVVEAIVLDPPPDGAPE
jgi:hypothetical protein